MKLREKKKIEDDYIGIKDPDHIEMRFVNDIVGQYIVFTAYII